MLTSTQLLALHKFIEGLNVLAQDTKIRLYASDGVINIDFFEADNVQYMYAYEPTLDALTCREISDNS